MSKRDLEKSYFEVKHAFLTEGEREQFEKIMKRPEDQKIHKSLMKEKISFLYAKAMSLISRVELGEFNEEQMEIVERAIAHCLNAIEEAEQILEKEKLPEM